MDELEFARTFPTATLDEAFDGLERLTGTPRAALEHITRSGATMSTDTELNVANALAQAHQPAPDVRPAGE
ncbi:hypothetical protein [Streptacidiphilus anmyonensis]|uniref:hypothetical protein n=1 Tax=Streptacidiphilus anmyonensis TaxID=405782 RepID=UPI001364BBE4|nr:hypothetical protein [Streptacidiphilus anmyonensis]